MKHIFIVNPAAGKSDRTAEYREMIDAAERLKLPAAATLVKARHTRPQSGLDSAEARRANALGAYALLPGVDVAGKRVLLADDVVTSGATLSECARTLLEAGAAEVWCVTLAQARPS